MKKIKIPILLFSFLCFIHCEKEKEETTNEPSDTTNILTGYGVIIDYALDKNNDRHNSTQTKITGIIEKEVFDQLISEKIVEIGYIYDTIKDFDVWDNIARKTIGLDYYYRKDMLDSITVPGFYSGNISPVYLFNSICYDSLKINTWNNYFKSYIITETGNIYYSQSSHVNTSKGTWKKKTSYPGDSTNDLIGVSLNEKGYILGGNTNNVWGYAPQLNKWEQKTDFPVVLTKPNYLIINNSLYICSNQDSIHGANFWKYNENTDTWEEKAAAPFLNGNIATFSVSDYGYYAGKQFGKRTNSFYRYDPYNDKWNHHKDTYNDFDIIHYIALNDFLFLFDDLQGRLDLNNWEFDGNLLCSSQNLAKNICGYYLKLIPYESCTFILNGEIFLYGEIKDESNWGEFPAYHLFKLHKKEKGHYEWHGNFNSPTVYENGTLQLVGRKNGIAFTINNVAYVGLGYKLIDNGNKVDLNDFWSFEL